MNILQRAKAHPGRLGDASGLVLDPYWDHSKEPFQASLLEGTLPKRRLYHDQISDDVRACHRQERQNSCFMAESMITYRGVVYPWHCDHMGHMNVMWYVGKFDEATSQLLAAVGAAPSRLRNEGFGLAAVEQRIEYNRELRAGDVLTIRSSILEAKEKSMRFTHAMTNDQTGELAATTVLVGVCIDLATRKARALPPDIFQRVASLV